MNKGDLQVALNVLNLVRGFSNDEILALPEDQFIMACRLLNPQRYGKLCEAYVCKTMGLKQKRGNAWWDAEDAQGLKYEIKATLPSHGKAYNLVQIRLFHPCDGYYIMGSHGDEIKIWLLTHDQMEKECEYANSAHGKTDRTRTDQELRLSFLPGSETEKYWDKHFLVYRKDIA